MVALPVEINPYVGEAAIIAANHNIEIPLYEQPRLFLETVWSAIPSGLFGVAYDYGYFNKQHKWTTSWINENKLTSSFLMRHGEVIALDYDNLNSVDHQLKQNGSIV